VDAGRAQSRSRRGREQRGAALIEAAIIVPLLMLLTFGAIEMGIGFSEKGGLESAARAGARKAATLTNVVDNVNNNDIGIEVANSVNAALDGSAIPPLDHLFVYKNSVSSPVTVNAPGDCSTDCVMFTPDGSGKHFDVGSATGSWPNSDRNGCGTTPDLVTVKIIGHFTFLSGLIGTSPVTLTATTSLQFEPTNCRQ
jgi:hypothetical protein